MIITANDEKELESRGISKADFLSQLHQFVYGNKPLKLEKPCSKGDGILELNASEGHRLLGIFEEHRKKSFIVKFVPASGAASRMFRHLYNYNPENLSDLTEEFIINFKRFPFYGELKQMLESKGILLGKLIQENRWEEIFKWIVGEDGLNYINAPKGLITFHSYKDGSRTAYEEQIVEALSYARDKDNACYLHFTLSPQHFVQVEEFIKGVLEKYQYDEIHVSCSVQEPSTETIALNIDNNPLRDDHGNLIFRPSGHGALIHNLQKVNADIIFIKNIDNISTDQERTDTIFFKQALGGLLFELKDKTFDLLNRLENEQGEDVLGDALEFIQNWFQPGLPLGMSREQLKKYALLRLDRPLRVCGMVRNEGEPGGGPFWVKMPDGHISKQIVERSQVDMQDVHQARIYSNASYFNPVDIVCSIRNRKDENYNLGLFIDYSTGFVSEKFHSGKVIKALELPGLWNGSMALWNTVFVEVPVSTFTPVKTVNDLLRAGHQEV